jgi:predicted O-linked N-acetylglucosamine transferase (SPINDLY family)
VLWLTAGPDQDAEAALRDEARQRGIDPRRLIFAVRLADKSQHLNRHRLADLFLDSLTFGAATTATDALWAGLPVLTRRSTITYGRIGESLLRAAGLPQLIVKTAADYIAAAVALARDHHTLAAIKKTVADRARRAPLYDAHDMARQFEALYAHVWERHASGARPASFDITTTSAPRLVP